MTSQPTYIVQPVLDAEVRKLCYKRYPGHPKGCPNYGKRAACPPAAKLLPDILDLAKPAYCIWNKFPLFEHVDRLRVKHANWTDRQLYCCLYWQAGARKQLRLKVKAFLETHPGLKVLNCPEACGVNITATIKQLGIELEWPPVEFAYQVALLGTPRIETVKTVFTIKEKDQSQLELWERNS